MPFMNYQAPNIQQANPVGSYMNALGAKQQYDMNALKMDREQKAIAKDEQASTLATEYATTKDKDIFSKLVAIDPQKANTIMDSFNKMDDRQVQEAQRKSQNIAKLTFDLASDKDDNSVLQKYSTLYQGMKPEQQQGLPPPNQVDANTIRQLSTKFTNEATDFNTLITYRLNKELKQEDRAFTSSENALNRANQREVAQMGYDKSMDVAKLQAETSRYSTDTNAELYRDGVKGSSGINKANAIEKSAYDGAIKILTDPFSGATPQQKQEATQIVNTLNQKYGVSQDNNVTPQQPQQYDVSKYFKK